MRCIIIILSALLLSSCAIQDKPQRKLSKLLYKYPHLKETTVQIDTNYVTINDTLYTDSTVIDTSFFLDSTIVFEKDKIIATLTKQKNKYHLKIIKDRDTIPYLDTIPYIDTTEVSIIEYTDPPQELRRKYGIKGAFIGGGLVLLLVIVIALLSIAYAKNHSK